jgi:molybdopterin-containing oxidoreductase family membrane subunit
MGPRFLASAFAAGPALIIIVLNIVQSTTSFRVEDQVFNKIRRISVVAAIINLIMLFSEVFKEFYLPTHHSQPAIYLYFGLKGHTALVPWIWTAIVMNVIGTLTMAFNPGKNNPCPAWCPHPWERWSITHPAGWRSALPSAFWLWEYLWSRYCSNRH